MDAPGCADALKPTTRKYSSKKIKKNFFLGKIELKLIKVQHLGYDQEFEPNKFDDHFTNSHQKSGKTFMKNKNPGNVIFHSNSYLDF